jgi:hypothetical protein
VVSVLIFAGIGAAVAIGGDGVLEPALPWITT